MKFLTTKHDDYDSESAFRNFDSRYTSTRWQVSFWRKFQLFPQDSSSMENVSPTVKNEEILIDFKIAKQKNVPVLREKCDFSLAWKAMKILSVLAHRPSIVIINFRTTNNQEFSGTTVALWKKSENVLY